MWITGAGVGLDFSRTTHSFQNKPYPVSNRFCQNWWDNDHSWSFNWYGCCVGQSNPRKPAFCFEPLSGAGKNIFNQFHHFSAISYLPLFSSFALFFYFCFFFYLLLFMFDIFLGTRVPTVLQIAMTVDYVLWREDQANKCSYIPPGVQCIWVHHNKRFYFQSVDCFYYI